MGSAWLNAATDSVRTGLLLARIRTFGSLFRSISLLGLRINGFDKNDKHTKKDNDAKNYNLKQNNDWSLPMDPCAPIWAQDGSA